MVPSSSHFISGARGLCAVALADRHLIILDVDEDEDVEEEVDDEEGNEEAEH